MVTLVSQSLSEFDLHARAIFGLPIGEVASRAPAASAVILADRDADAFRFGGLADVLAIAPEVDVRLFGKPVARPFRRMGVALAPSADADAARDAAVRAAATVRIDYD